MVLEGEEEAVHVLVQSKDMGLMKIRSSISIIIVSVKTRDGCIVVGIVAIQVSINRTDRVIGGRGSARAREVFPSPTLEGGAKKTIEMTEFVRVRDNDLELCTSIEEMIRRTAVITSLVGVVREEFVDVKDSVVIINELTNVKRGRNLTDGRRRRSLRGRFQRKGTRFQISRKGLRSKVRESNPRSGVTNEGDKLMRLIVKGNRCVEGKITRVAEEISLEMVKRRMKIGKEGLEEPTVQVEDTMETVDQKKVEPALTVVNEGLVRLLTRFTRSGGSMTKGRVTGGNGNATKNGVAIRLM